MSHDQRAAARADADLVVADLMSVSGMLEEVATLWRRAELYGQQSSSSSPGNLQDAAKSLVDAVRALPDADCGQHPVLAFSAVAQLAVLEKNAALSAAMMDGSHLDGGGMQAAIQGRLRHAGKELWNLLSHLARIGEPSPPQDGAACQDTLATCGVPGRAEQAAAAPGQWRQALAEQRAAIDALPEAELRRLLSLIGGLDPAALQRAAAAYTETFGAVAEVKASVAALQPVIRAMPRAGLQDPAL